MSIKSKRKPRPKKTVVIEDHSFDCYHCGGSGIVNSGYNWDPWEGEYTAVNERYCPDCKGTGLKKR